MAATTLRLGWTDPHTDSFGAHPLLGDIVDLNDGVTFTLVDGTLELDPPPREVALAGNARSQGERVTRAIYRHNRQARAQLTLGPMATAGDLIATVRALVRWLDAAPAVPVCLQWQPPSATSPVYLDVVGAAHGIPADERDWLRLQLEPIEIVFLVRPGLRGDRVTLSNLVTNPGFEAPSGAGVTIFDDSFATLNAYAGSGGALTQDVTTYSDVVFADSPLRFYRLDESAGPTVYDASSSGQNGTANPAINFLQASALNGSSDASANFPNSGYIALPTTGLPTGNSAFTLEGWFTSSSAATQMIAALGGAASKTAGLLYLTASGQLAGDLYSASITSPGAYNDGAWHHAVFTWDGTNARLYADGAQVVSSATLGPNNLSYGAATIGAQYTTVYVNLFDGNLDEITIYASALSSTRISAHYAAGHNALAAAANTLQVPAGATATFGSPSWGAISQWQVRFRFRSGVTAYFNAHGSGNNNMGVEIGGNTLYLQQTIAGAQHLLGSAGFTTINEAWYWLTFTQFPTVAGVPCDVQVSVFADANGSLGAQLASITATPTYDASTALLGQAQFSASGASLGIGGAYVTRSTHSLTLFGPGAWNYVGRNGSTGLVAGAWDQNTANTYNGGAVTSFGALRMDLPPAGTVNAYAETWSGGAPGGSSAIPATTGQTINASAYVRSTGLSGTATLALLVREWDSSGVYLRATALQTLMGNHAPWTALSGSLTLGASTTCISVLLQVIDTTAGASANGTVWWENVQCWNVTTTGQATMPYCELRFRQSPAQLLLTGLLGDLPAPAYVAWGTYLTSWATGATLSYALGRRAKASANAQMAGASVGYYGPGVSPQSTAILDATSYGGYYAQALANPSWNPRAFSFPPADLLGVYHLFSRFSTTQAAGNLGNLETRVVTQQKTGAWFGSITNADQVGAYNGPFAYPISQSATWTVCDSGQVNVPALPSGALTDLSATYLTPRSQWGDLTAGGSTCRSDWQLLLPVDGSLLVGVVNNPSNAPFAVTASWLWVYHDGLLLNRSGIGDTAATTYSVESQPTANPAHGGGGPGTSSTGVINVNGGADPALTLDPSVAVAATSTAAGGNGVNQLAGYVADNAGAVLPLHVEIQYSPLYLYPR